MAPTAPRRSPFPSRSDIGYEARIRRARVLFPRAVRDAKMARMFVKPREATRRARFWMTQIE